MIGKRAQCKEERRDIIEKLLKLWEKHPELRLGQLVYNLSYRKFQDVFYIEDYDLISEE